MAIENFSFPTTLTTKKNGSTLQPTEWNDAMLSIQTKFNELVSAANNGSSSPETTDKFYVNGVEKAPVNGVIALSSQASYTLRGTLNGKIVIGDASEAALTEDTEIFLDGVTIKANDNSAYGIYYASKSQSMIVTLAKNKVNIIICAYEQTMAEQQGAALYSENNMILQGGGYLAVENKGGHGIKASELRISGRPHIYVEAIHDGVHGNSSLRIDGGYICVNKGNDAFGTGSTGQILLFGGTFEAHNIAQKVFDSKVAGYWFDNVRVITDVTNIYEGMSACDPATYFGIGSVTDGGAPVIPEVITVGEAPNQETYSLYSCSSTSVMVSGYLPNSLILINTSKTDVSISNAYITNKLAPCIKYKLDSSKVALKVAKDTTNIVRQTSDKEALPAIESHNNIEMEVKGGAIFSVSSTLGNGIECSELTFQDMKGVCSICGCGRNGVMATAITIGGSTTKSGNMPVYGVVEAFGNKEVDLFARLSGSGSKAKIEIKTPADTFLKGIVACGTLRTSLGSLNGSVINLGESKRFYFNEVLSGSLNASEGATKEPYDYVTPTDNLSIR